MVLRVIRIDEARVRFSMGPLLRQGFAVQAQEASKTPQMGSFALSGEAVSCVALAEQGYNRIMHYVYILQSQVDGSLYVGVTEDIKRRFVEHNNGNAKYSSSKRPYKLKWFCAFPTKQKALIFERYLKHGSGFAFARKHLI